ncbi:recombinase family protein [Chloroflexota bacterium]
MKAAIYCRVSTEDQEREGTSLQSQLEACKKLAKEKGYEVEEQYVIREVYSGLTLNRPDLTKLRDWLNTREINAVVIYSSDRFSRDGYDFLTLIRDCQKADVELLCVTEPIEHGQVGELLSYMRGWASRMEADKIKERTMRGIRERAKGGRLPGGGRARLYGYDYVPGKGVGEGIRYINKEEAQWVKQIFQWYISEGLTINGIVYRLRLMGVTSPSGRDWSKAALHKILRRVAYTGRTYTFTQSRKGKRVIARPREEWIEIPGATPPIISEELFNQVQVKLQRNKELATRNSKGNYLLSGYVFCSLCGRRYYGGSATRTSTKTGRTYDYRYYRCPKNFKIVSPTICPNNGWKADYLEDLVWKQIEELLVKPEIVLFELENKRSKLTTTNSNEAEIETIEAQIRRTENEKDRVWKAFELTGDQDKFTAEVKDVMDRLENLERHRTELGNRIEASHQEELDMEGIKEFCELASNNLAGFTYEDKRLALEALRIKVWVSDNHIRLEGAIPQVDCPIESTIAW